MQVDIKREFIHKMKSGEKDLKIFNMLLDMENRIRILEGKAPFNKKDFVEHLKTK